jgi:hypothetical protein
VSTSGAEVAALLLALGNNSISLLHNNVAHMKTDAHFQRRMSFSLFYHPKYPVSSLRSLPLSQTFVLKNSDVLNFVFEISSVSS